MIVPMAKIRILGPRTLRPDVTALLQDAGNVHIESAPADIPRIQSDLPYLHRHALEPDAQQARGALESALEKVRRIQLLLPVVPEAPGRAASAGLPPLPADATEGSLKILGARLDSLSARAAALVEGLKRHRDELSLIDRYEKVVGVLAPLVGAVGEDSTLECTGLLFPARERAAAALLEQAFALLTGGRYEILYREVDKDTLAGLLIFPRERAQEAKALLQEKNIGELRLPASVADRPLPEAIGIIARKRAEIPGAIRDLEAGLSALAREWRGTLEELKGRLEGRIARILVSASFFETRRVFLLFGWIPEDELPRIEASVATRFGGAVVVERLPVARAEEEGVPVVLRNRPVVRPFEVFTRILPLPRYGTIDPTPLVALFFPLFYGMIIGDIGYGLLLLAAAAAARRRAPDPFLASASAVFFWSALSAIAWGVAYGELFGDLGKGFGLRPLFLHRMEDFRSGLLFALGIGVFHVLLGIVLGVRSAVRRGDGREAVAKAAGLLLLAGAVAAVAGISGAAPRLLFRIGAAGILVAVPVMVLSGGAGALMELHNLVNVLSYLRIMGIGVASVALACAANRIVAVAGIPGLGSRAGLVLHAVNLAFCILSPTIQALRLHYVEFFENFYRGGGRAYQPFQNVA